MKFVRYGAPGTEQPGLIDHDGGLRALAGHIRDIDLSLILSSLRA